MGLALALALAFEPRCANGHAARMATLRDRLASHGCSTVRLPQRLGFRNGYIN